MLRFLIGVGLVDFVHGTHHAASTFLSAVEEAHEEALHRSFLFVGLGCKAILQDIIFGCGKFLDATKSAVVVGEHQAFGTDNHAGAEVAEIHDAVLQTLALGVIQLQRTQFKAQTVHHVGCLLVDSVQHPHALIGLGCHAAQEQQGK